SFGGISVHFPRLSLASLYSPIPAAILVFVGASSDFAIDLRSVSKIYNRRIHALRGIDMKVNRGEIFGLLGPNGAGKSTLVKIMTTIVRPTHAEGTLLNNPIGHKPTLRKVGYLPENHRFP